MPWLQHLPHTHCTRCLKFILIFLNLTGFCFAVYYDIHGAGCTTPSPVALSEARPGSAASGIRVWHGTPARGWFSSSPISSRYSSSWMFNCRKLYRKIFCSGVLMKFIFILHFEKNGYAMCSAVLCS
uniref:Uncharacterized protein n=1 Tax=Triticum urartu TaxID=4572 RepID=A0A8R7R2Z0_TRIUA